MLTIILLSILSGCKNNKIYTSNHTHKNNNCDIIIPYRNGNVLRKYDVVEYHYLKSNEPGKLGDEKYVYTYNNKGAKYKFYFINEKNKKTFAYDPEKYIPQFGGFCSWGMANEWHNDEWKNMKIEECNECLTKWQWSNYLMGPPADPIYGWSIYKNKLYFNINQYYKKLWEDKKDIFIKRAEKRWKHYYDKDTGPINVHSFPDTWKTSNKITKDQKDCLENK
jgi:YHS domain-containing protein